MPKKRAEFLPLPQDKELPASPRRRSTVSSSTRSGGIGGRKGSMATMLFMGLLSAAGAAGAAAQPNTLRGASSALTGKDEPPAIPRGPYDSLVQSPPPPVRKLRSKRPKATPAPSTSTTPPPTSALAPATTIANLGSFNGDLPNVGLDSFVQGVGLCTNMSPQQFMSLFSGTFSGLKGNPNLSKVIGTVALAPLQQSFTPEQLATAAAHVAIAGENCLSPAYQDRFDDAQPTMFGITSMYTKAGQSWQDIHPVAPEGTAAAISKGRDMANAFVDVQTQVQAIMQAAGFSDKGIGNLPPQISSGVSSGITLALVQNGFTPLTPKLPSAYSSAAVAATTDDALNEKAAYVVESTDLALDQFMLQLGALLSYYNHGNTEQTPETQQAMMQILYLAFSKQQAGYQASFLPYISVLMQVAQQYYEEGIGLQDISGGASASLQRLMRLVPVLEAANIMTILGFKSSAQQSVIDPVLSTTQSRLAQINSQLLNTDLAAAKAAAEQFAGQASTTITDPNDPQVQTIMEDLINNDAFAQLRSIMQPQLAVFPGDIEANNQKTFYGAIYDTIIKPLGYQYTGGQFFSKAPDSSDPYYSEDITDGHAMEMIFWAARVCNDDSFFAGLYAYFQGQIEAGVDGADKSLAYVEWVRGNADAIFPPGTSLQTTTLSAAEYTTMKEWVDLVNNLQTQHGNSIAGLERYLSTQKGSGIVPGTHSVTNKQLLAYLQGTGEFSGSNGYIKDSALLSQIMAANQANELLAANALSILKQGVQLQFVARRALRGSRS